MAAQLFISYRRSHKAEVLATKAALEGTGLRVWLDLDDIPPLAEFTESIRDGIRTSHAMLVWWSADYGESDICLQEFRFAWQRARRLNASVAERVWVLNPEATGHHIFAGDLNSSNFLSAPKPGEAAAWASDLRQRLEKLHHDGPFGDEPAPLPALYGVFPPRATFSGRGAELMHIHSALFAPRVGASAVGVAVQTHGLGGIGKTELAAQYVKDFAAAYPAGVLWLNLAGWQPARPVTEAEAQTAWLRALDQALSNNYDSLRADLILDAEGKPRSAPQVRERLAHHFGANYPCLVVLDNLPELSPVDVRQTILKFFGAHGALGKTLITTRDARQIDGYTPIPLDVMNTEDALRLLARYFPNVTGSKEEQADDRQRRFDAQCQAMRDLIAEVGGHTLALALLGEHYGGLEDGYLTALTDLRRAGQLQRIEAIAGQLREELGDRARGIVATFAISIEQLSEAAHQLLSLASVCAPNTPIPDGLLALAFGGQVKADDFAQARRALLRASLLELRGEGDALRIHPLVAQAVLALLKANRAELEAALAEVLLERLAVLRDDASQARALSAYADHARYLACSFTDQIGIRLFLSIGMYEMARGEFARAVEAHGAAVKIANKTLGEEHPLTLSAMGHCAGALKKLGDWAGARELEEDVLRVFCRNGEAHPAAFNAMANLAATLYLQGDFAGARLHQEIVFAVYLKRLGEHHLDTIHAMGELAVTLRALGELASACALYEQVLSARSAILGDEHPETIVAMSNLADIHRALGDPRGARLLQERVLAIHRKLFGVRHPDTSVVAWNLLMTLSELNDVMALGELLFSDLFWLSEEEPENLGIQQRTIRTRVRNTLGLEVDDVQPI